ncbi:MAG: cupin domain-containing protein [Clostridia bacterium]|nr:cupin domain-containing protein [Clostridia bacterium]MBQ4575952.1 cupin domain-containing protein [Clostridia bacterium]
MLPQIKQIADRIRELREILEIPAEQIARDIGVDDKTYAAYENAEDDIPIGKLYLIAATLGVDPTVLLVGDAPRMVDYTIVRGGEGIGMERYEGYKFVSLAYNYINRDMEPMLVTLEPGSEHAELVTHEGQEFNYVIEGTVAVTLRDKEHILNAGDSIYFNPQIPHRQHAVGDKTAKFITIINE